MNNPTFIPILSIPGLMADNSEYYRNFLMFSEQKNELFPREYDIDNQGRAIIEIVLRPEIKVCKKMKVDGKKVPFINSSALIDTGASISVIRKSRIKELNLKAFPGATFEGLNKKPQRGRNVNLSVHINNIFPNLGFLDICPMLSELNEEAKFDFVIGWDVLRFCRFSYNNSPNKRYKFKMQFAMPKKKHSIKS